MTKETQILPGKYTKKPVTIDAFCLGVDYIPEWFMDKVTSNEITLRGAYSDLQSCEINTLEGVMVGKKGDWIIKGVKGEIYPCKPDIFASTYDIASTPAIADGVGVEEHAAMCRAVLALGNACSHVNWPWVQETATKYLREIQQAEAFITPPQAATDDGECDAV